MGTIMTKEGSEIFCKDWGTGHPIVFQLGWPFSAADWASQMLYFLGKGYRVNAHDRRRQYSLRVHGEPYPDRTSYSSLLERRSTIQSGPPAQFIHGYPSGARIAGPKTTP